MAKSRNVSLDAVGGLFIIQMIMMHAFQRSGIWDDTTYERVIAILFCYMPWFFFKSGMFYKEKPLGQTIQHGIRRLIMPFAIYSIIGQIFTSWQNYLTTGDKNWIHYVLSPIKDAFFSGSFSGNLPLWFLISLFLVKLIVGLADKYKINKICLLCSALILSGGGTILIKYNNHLPYWVFSSALGLVFYLFGYYFRESQYKNKWVKFLGLLAALVAIIGIPSGVDLRTDTTYKGLWIIYIIGSVGSIIIINNLFRLRIFQFPILTSIGRESMEYYCAHWILFTIILLACQFPNNDIPNYTCFWTLLMFSILILPQYSWILHVIRTKKIENRT